MRKKVAIALNTSWNLLNFRAGLIRSLVEAGYEVVAIAPPDKYSEKLSDLGCRFVPIKMDTQGTHPVRELLLLCRFFTLLRLERPDIYLGFTVKPNLYGSLGAHALGIPVISNITGLGSIFTGSSRLIGVVMALYRFALCRCEKVFFQNMDDRHFFIKRNVVREEMTDLLPGSGVDLAKFSPLPFPRERKVRFLLIARMLWDKGIGEFIAAARLLREEGLDAEFFLLGFLDVENPSAISRTQIDEWVAEGVVGYLGVSDDVREQIADAHCIVLPSYREGTPRSLLEAAAVGRPIVTTQAIGCREVVEDGLNGYLCNIKDAMDLADKMRAILKTSLSELQAMGRRGREKVEREFDERIVVQKYLKAIDSIL